jgi:CDP-6-deoxy-D-xylo-4-hexulose-3-dehydrase
MITSLSADKFSLASDTFDDLELSAAKRVLDSGNYTMGDKVKEFEAAIGQWVGAKNVIMVNSGSSANLLLVQSLLSRSNPDLQRLSPGDEVLVPSLSWSTTVWPIVQLGLVPVFVDCDPQTLAIDLVAAKKSLSPKTKAVFLIHILGLSAEMKAFTQFCQENKLVLLEDCCESMGAFFGGRHVGTFGIGGTLSHFFSHHLTTIEGGCIFTDDDALADDLRSMRAHGWIRERSDKTKWVAANKNLDPRFMFIMPGYNVRPMELQAAIGLVQLKKLDSFLEKREAIAKKASEIFSEVPWLHLIGKEFLQSSPSRKERRHSWMNLPIKLSKDAPVNVTRVQEILENAGVETRPIIAGNFTEHPGIHHIKHRIGSSLNHSKEILSQGFMIGCHPKLESKHFEILSKAIKDLKNL